MTETDPAYGIFRPAPEPRPFENLVSLDVSWPGNRLGDRFPVNLLLEVGEHHLEVPMTPGIAKRIVRNLKGRSAVADSFITLRIRLHHCDVLCKEHNITILSETKYRNQITKGKFDTRTTEKSRSIKSSRLGGALSGILRLNPSEHLPSLGLQATAGIVRQQNLSNDTIDTRTPDIREVEQIPNGWRVGDRKYGDPIKLSSCLDGPYFKVPVTGYPQTCMATFQEGHQQGVLTFTVIVRDGLHIDRIDGGVAGKGDKDGVVAEMRNKLAAIRLETSNTEMSIAKVTCEVFQATGGEPAHEQSPQVRNIVPVTEAPNNAAARRRRTGPRLS